ncbi:ATP synthase F(0) complex subunit C2, mitochondrial [Lemmus lemmus]
MRPSAAGQSLVLWPYSSLASASKPVSFPGTSTQPPSSLGLGLLLLGWLALGLGLELFLGASSYARNPSLKQQLFSYAILGFTLSEAMGLFCLMVAFLILFAM